MSDHGSILFEELNNPGVDLVVELEIARWRMRAEVAYDIAKEEMRKNMQLEIEREARRGRPDLHVV